MYAFYTGQSVRTDDLVQDCSNSIANVMEFYHSLTLSRRYDLLKLKL